MLARVVLWLQMHLIINDQGEILSFYLTKGIVDDRNIKLMTSITEQIFGNYSAIKVISLNL